MSQQKKQEDTTTNRELYNRLRRLKWTKATPEFVIAYLGLILCGHGKQIKLARACRIIKESQLDLKIKKNSIIPTENLMESLIYLVIHKRTLCEELFSNRLLPVWQDEHSAPLLDILQELSRIYKV